MSADNGVYILVCDDGYRVQHAQAIENLTYEPGDNGFNDEEVRRYFENCPVFTEEEADLYGKT